MNNDVDKCGDMKDIDQQKIRPPRNRNGLIIVCKLGLIT